MKDFDPIEALKGDLFFIAPVIALTALGLIVLMYDFALLRKKPGPERRGRLGWLTLLGVVGIAGLQVAMMLPADRGGFNTAGLYVSLFSGVLTSDGVTSWMDLTLLGLLALIVAQSMAWDFTEHWGEYFALLCWSGVGMMLLVASEELLTLFLTLETMTLCLYMMAAFEKGKRRSAEGGLKYFVYGSVSSALFLFGLSLIYGLTGSTRIDAIQGLLAGGSAPKGLQGNLAGAVAVLLVLVGFGFKIAAVPFHQWAPDAYEGAPAPVTAWVATGSKIASFVAMIKVLVGGLAPWAMRPGELTSPGWIGLIAAISAATMTFGNFAALAQKNFKRMLAYSSIAHAGYMLVGVLAASVSTTQKMDTGPVLFYLVVYSFATAGALAVAAWIVRDTGRDDIAELDGLGSRSPFLAVCIVLLMLSLIGMPPLAGFFGKLYMFMEAMNTGEKGRITLTWLVALGLFNSVVSAFYYVRVLKAMFLRPARSTTTGRAPLGVTVSVVAATAVAVGCGLYPTPLLRAMTDASKTRPLGDIRHATSAEPGFRTTPEERLEQAKKGAAEFTAKGGGASAGGSAPKGKAGGPPGGGGGGGAPKGKAQGKGQGKGKGKASATPPASPKAEDRPKSSEAKPQDD